MYKFTQYTRKVNIWTSITLTCGHNLSPKKTLVPGLDRIWPHWRSENWTITFSKLYGIRFNCFASTLVMISTLTPSRRAAEGISWHSITSSFRLQQVAMQHKQTKANITVLSMASSKRMRVWGLQLVQTGGYTQWRGLQLVSLGASLCIYTESPKCLLMREALPG